MNVKKKTKVGILLNPLQSMHVFSQYPRTTLEGTSTDLLFIEGDMGRTILEGGKKTFFIIDYWLQGIVMFMEMKLVISLGSTRRESCGPRIPSFLPTANAIGFTWIPHRAASATQVQEAEYTRSRIFSAHHQPNAISTTKWYRALTGGGESVPCFRSPFQKKSPGESKSVL